MQGIIGIVAILALAWLLSESRRNVEWRAAAVGIALQLVIAVALLEFPPARDALLLLNHVVYAIEDATLAGTRFVFGFLGGGELPYAPTREEATYVFAFRVLPQILVFSVLVAVLWYWRVLPFVIRLFARALRRTLGVGGAVGVAAASSVFLGMVEAPLVIRAYLANLSRSELFIVMTCGMSTVAGSIMVLYANVLATVVDASLGHVLIASVVNTIGAIVIARIMLPGEHTAEADVAVSLGYESTMDAVVRGTGDGLRLVVNVGAMLIVLVSLVALVNGVLGVVEVGEAPLTLQRIMGWLLAPLAWAMGIPWDEAGTAGALLGTKLILNELVAYIELADLPPGTLSESTRLILTYALCGFANFGSLGILMGGIGALVPERRADLLTLAPRTLVSGTLVTCMTGAIVGVVSAVGSG